MNQVIISKSSPVKTLSISAAPLRELLNLLIYRNNPPLLNERARKQAQVSLARIPSSIKELGVLLGAVKCEKGRKLYFDCADMVNHRAVLIHNLNAQFWVHFFRCGIGLVSVSTFNELACAEGSVLPLKTRNIEQSYEYQWFTHNLGKNYFAKDKLRMSYKRLARYFIEKINPGLIVPYSIFYERSEINESYLFVKGSLVKLKEVLRNALLVYEGIKREKYGDENCRVSPYLTVTCGNLKNVPILEVTNEYFLDQIGQLAVRENVPYSVLDESNYRRVESSRFEWVRKNKHRFYFNFAEELRNMLPREKLSARFQLVDWLKKQGSASEQIIKFWKLE